MLARGGGFDALDDRAAEVGVALCGEADAIGARGDRTEAVPIDAGVGTLEQAAVDERAQQAEDGGLGQPCALDHVVEAEFLAEGAEGLEDFAGAEDSLGLVAVAAAVGVRSEHLFDVAGDGLERFGRHESLGS